MYIAQTDLTAYVQDDMLTQGLDDNGDAAVDAGLFDAIYAAVENEVHAALEGRYTVPITTSVPYLIKHACLVLCAEALWMRRGAAKDANPFDAAAKDVRARLARITKGEDALAVATAPETSSGEEIVEPSATYPTSGRLGL